MSRTTPPPSPTSVSYHVDEAGDGVLFGPRGRDRSADTDAPRYFMLGMTRCAADDTVSHQLTELRAALQRNPLYASIHSMKPASQKTSRAFHAKDDHAEIRSKVFELITEMDFKFYAVIKDMRKVRDYLQKRNRMNAAIVTTRSCEDKAPMDIGFASAETMKHTAWSRISSTGRTIVPRWE